MPSKRVTHILKDIHASSASLTAECTLGHKVTMSGTFSRHELGLPIGYFNGHVTGGPEDWVGRKAFVSIQGQNGVLEFPNKIG